MFIVAELLYSNLQLNLPKRVFLLAKHRYLCFVPFSAKQRCKSVRASNTIRSKSFLGLERPNYTGSACSICAINCQGSHACDTVQTRLNNILDVTSSRTNYRALCFGSRAPVTIHGETVVLLSKGEIDSKKVRVEFSLEDMDMSGFQKGATYEQIKAYVLEHTGLKVSSLYISQIKRKCGLDVGHNYNLSKKEDAKVPQCPPEKEVAIREAFNYFGML